jgi:3-oxoacyl-[acyl-carrier protein] reductase
MTIANENRGSELAGQTVVVTGAGRGIGRAIAIRYAAAGASIVAAAKSSSGIERTARAIRGSGGRAVSVVVDVRDEDAVSRLFRRASAEYGRVDMAVLNAGIYAPQTPIERVPSEQWHESMDVNVTGVFFGIRASIPYLRAAGGGKILVMGSGASRRAPDGLAAYAASKAAVTALVRVAARDLRQYDIAVNELQPGPTATRLHGVPESDPDTLVNREVVLEEGLEDDSSIAGEWFKSPRSVADFALLLACLPNRGPSGQLFSLNSVI